MTCFSGDAVHLPGAHAQQWVAEADALCHIQRVSADPHARVVVEIQASSRATSRISPS